MKCRLGEPRYVRFSSDVDAFLASKADELTMPISQYIRLMVEDKFKDFDFNKMRAKPQKGSRRYGSTQRT